MPPFHRQEYLLVSGKETYNFTAHSFNNAVTYQTTTIGTFFFLFSNFYYFLDIKRIHSLLLRLKIMWRMHGLFLYVCVWKEQIEHKYMNIITENN